MTVSSNSSSSSTETRSGFDQFEFHEFIERGLQQAGYTEPRPIQAETIPAALEGYDVLGLAQTGTGKTAAFALPMLDRLLDENPPGPRALVLAPTRELATQISVEVGRLAEFTKLKTITIFGGVSMNRQINALRRRPEIIVGCPGRVLDLLQQGVLDLSGVETLVLDEADHMFDMGFLPSIRKIISALPDNRQNLLFSATMPQEIRGLAHDILWEPHVVELADRQPASTIDHALHPIDEGNKKPLLNHILGLDDCSSAIVFTRTKHRAKKLALQLDKAGHSAVALQGNMSQGQRDRAMGGFRSGKFNILVATDIAARGIDVSNISHVINFDVPNTPEAYTHRIGRTGRSETDGIAITFVTKADRGWVRDTERMIGKPIERREMEGFTPPPASEREPLTATSGNGRQQQNRRPRNGRPQGNGRSGGSGSNSGAKSGAGNGPGNGAGSRRRRQRRAG